MTLAASCLIFLHLMFQGVLLMSTGKEMDTGEIESVSDILSKANANITWLVEGDIAVKVEGKKIIFDQNRIWPNSVMYYTFTSGIISSNVNEVIEKAMQQYTSQTCVRFVQRTNEMNYVRFQDTENGCYSFLGMTGGAQPINLGNGCGSESIIVHEIGHALGLIHEQNRPDRDTYVTINTANIDPGLERQFEISTNTRTFNIPYDFLSIMHYSQRAFSSNGQPTIVAKPPYTNFQNTMGSGQTLTPSDAAAVNQVYCGSSPPTAAPTTPTPVTPSITTPPPVTPPPSEQAIICTNNVERDVTVSVGQTFNVISSNYPNNQNGRIQCDIYFKPATPGTLLRVNAKDTNINEWCRRPLHMDIYTASERYYHFKYCTNDYHRYRSFTLRGEMFVSINSRQRIYGSTTPRRFSVTVSGVN